MHPYNTISVERTIERLRRFQESVKNADDKVSKALTRQDKDGLRGATQAKEACQAEIESIRKDLKRCKELIEAVLK